MQGIEIVYANIRKESSRFLPTLLRDLKIASAYNTIKAETKKNGYLEHMNTLSQNKQTIIDELIKKLRSYYAKDEPTTDTLVKAANNIFEAMVNTQFMGSDDDYDTISSYFAEQRKSQAIKQITNHTKLTGWGVGIHAFVSPSGMI
jgi:hypothetical protein